MNSFARVARPNVFLNYGYTVLAALVHRALLIQGLNPLLGVYHKTYYRKHPLVYDLMEPFRACVDLLLAEYLQQSIFPSISEWAKFIGQNLRRFRIARYRASVKLMDAVDVAAASLANCYRARSAAMLWLPQLEPTPHETPQETESLPYGLADCDV